jgi:hypothetical protein
MPAGKVVEKVIASWKQLVLGILFNTREKKMGRIMQERKVKYKIWNQNRCKRRKKIKKTK